MTERPVSVADLLYVLDHLWLRGVEELQRLGMGREDAFYRFLHYARTGYKARTLVADDRPVVVVGIADDGGEAFTWFQATAEFDRHASAITRYIRREAKAYPDALHIYSVCVHPDTERWFKVLGFVPTGDEAALPTGATLRKFTRK